jgi:hypothetical protein
MTLENTFYIYIQREHILYGMGGADITLENTLYIRTHSITCAIGGAEMIFTLLPVPFPPPSPPYLFPLSLLLCLCFLRLGYIKDVPNMTVLIGFVGTHRQSVQRGAIQYPPRHGCSNSPGFLRLAQQVLLNYLKSCPERERERSQQRCFSGWASPSHCYRTCVSS